MNRLLKEYRSAIDILESLLHKYQRGNKENFNQIAIQLRILLCDGRNGSNHSLLPKLFPEARLHPLFWTQFYKQYQQLSAPARCFMPGELKLDECGEVSFSLLLDITGERLTIEDWVEQPFIDPDITIEKFINLMADYDPDRQDREEIINRIKSKSLLLEHPECFRKLTAAIAEYILVFTRTTNIHSQPQESHSP
jgi:hypothetical protein